MRGCLFVLSLVVFVSCKKEGASGDEIVIETIGSSKNQPGLGDSDAEPLGTDFQLPPCVRIVNRPNKPFDPDIQKLFGNMNTFYVDISLVNDCNSPVMMEFQPGLIMLDVVPSRIQNGMLMDRVRINLPPLGRGPGGTVDTTTIYLGVACLNAGKGLPWGDNQEADVRDYPIGKGMHMPFRVTTDENLLKLLSLLADKPRLRVPRHYNPQEIFEPGYVEPEWRKIYSLIQEMVWEITDGDGIDKNEMETLKAAL